MEIVYRKLSELKPNPKNPRKSTEEAIEKLAESIKGNPKFFEARPILLSDRTGRFVIIGGERRSEAAALLKMEAVPTILMSGLTEAEEEEVLFLDNTHAGVWDEEKLKKWDREQLKSWGVIPEWVTGEISDEAVNALFEPNVDNKGNKPIKFEVVVPFEKQDVVEALKNELMPILSKFGAKIR